MKTIERNGFSNPLGTSTDIEILMEAPSERVPCLIRNATFDEQFEWETKRANQRNYPFPEPKFKLHQIKQMEPLAQRVLTKPKPRSWIEEDIYEATGFFALPKLA